MVEQFPYSFGRYRVEAEIGRGGFGAVYRAMDTKLDRFVAIKIMDPIYLRDRRWVTRFQREAKVMAKLDHPNIVPIYDTGEENGRLYLAMKLIDGPNLSQVIGKDGRLPWDSVVEIGEQLASALDYAHGQDIIHRDLKPGNILINAGVAMLTDFGLAKIVEDNSQSLSVSGGITGTYNYMPPEVFNNEDASPASDVYALGCVLYEMLVGKMLFEGKTPAAIVGAHLKGITLDETMPEGIPAGMRNILQMALAKEPADRYASAGELAQAMTTLAADQLAEPYTALELAIAEQRWQDAIELAAEIRGQDPKYRDVVALEDHALAGEAEKQRRHWAAQWQTSAEEALASDNFDEVRGAINQWRRVAPDDSELSRVENELHLAEQYVVLRGFVAAEDWEAAKLAAEAIYTKDPAFRDIVGLQNSINSHLNLPTPDDSPGTNEMEVEQDRRDAKVVMAGTAANKTASAARFEADSSLRSDTGESPVSAGEGKSQELPSLSRMASSGSSGKRDPTVPSWAWWAGAVGLLFVVVFGIYAMSRSSGDTNLVATETVVEEVEATRIVTEEIIVTAVPEIIAEPEIEEEAAATNSATLIIWANEFRFPVLEILKDASTEIVGVELVIEQISNLDMAERLRIAIPAGEGPDIFILSHDQIGSYVDSGLIAPLDLGAKADGFVPVSLQAFTYNSELFGMPYATENVALFRNTDLVSEPVKTWDDVRTVGEKLVADGTVDNVMVFPNTSYHIYGLHTAFGGYIFGQDEDGNFIPEDVGLDSEGFIASGDYIQAMVADGLVPSIADYETADALFQDGKIPFALNGPWVLNSYRESGVNYIVEPIPTGNAGLGSPFLGASGFVVNALGEKQQLAQTFLTDFVATTEIMDAFQTQDPRIPAWQETLDAVDDEDLAGFAVIMPYASPMPNIPQMGAVWDSWSAAVQLIMNGELSAEEALKDGADQIREAIAE